MIDPITAKEEEIAAWEARLVDIRSRARAATIDNYDVAALSLKNALTIVAHLRTQLQAMKRLRLMQGEPS